MRERCAGSCLPTSSSRTMCCSAVRSEQRAGRATSSRRTGRSSSTRCAAMPGCRRGGGRPSQERRPSSSARRTSARYSRTSSDTSSECTRCRRASTSTSSAPNRVVTPSRGSATRHGTTRRTPATRTSGNPTPATQIGSRRSSQTTRRPSCTSASCSTTRASTCCSKRFGASTPARWSSASATTAPSSRGSRRRARSSPDRSSIGISSTCSRSQTSRSCRRSFRRRSAWSRPRPRPRGRRRSSRATPASPRSRMDSRPSIRPPCVTSRASGPAMSTNSRRSSTSCSRSPRRSAKRWRLPHGARQRSGGAGRAWRSGSWNRFKYHSHVGDAQKLAPDEQIAFARDAFENADDLTVAVEEEFALLDPETLELASRFEELKAAAGETEWGEHVVGELISSEIEIKTGRCPDFTGVAERMAERRVQLGPLADEHGVALASTGTHPWSRWQDQRIIDTPHYRRNDEILRYVVWRNNSFGIHVHIAVRGADRAIAVCNAFRSVLPELLALSASSPFVEDVVTGLHSARTEIFTKLFPRAGIPDAYDGWAGFDEYVRFLYDTHSIDQHTQIWWSVRPHLAFPTVEVRICDAQPDLAEAQSLAALMYALGVRIARALDEREPILDPPRRLIEENLWRAIRYGLSGGLIDFERGEVVPTRARIEALIEWVLPMAEEIGAASYL